MTARLYPLVARASRGTPLTMVQLAIGDERC